MTHRKRYRRKPDQFVVAVQLQLEAMTFTYRKWGDDQTCKVGDWVVDNDGDVYTVDAESFARTYRLLRPGAYVKTTPIWAERSLADGRVRTKEGHTHHSKGDFLVSNNEDGTDSYAIGQDKFHSMYELDE